MGINAEFNITSPIGLAYENTDVLLLITANDLDGNLLATSMFTDAEYLIADKDGKVIIRKTLGDGITFQTTQIEVKVGDTEMNFTGEYTHQLTLFNIQGDRMVPIFFEPLQILGTLR